MCSTTRPRRGAHRAAGGCGDGGFFFRLVVTEDAPSGSPRLPSSPVHPPLRVQPTLREELQPTPLSENGSRRRRGDDRAAVARRFAAATSRFDWGERSDVPATNQGWPQSVDAEGEPMAASGSIALSLPVTSCGGCWPVEKSQSADNLAELLAL